MFNVRLSKKLDTGTSLVSYFDESFLFDTVEEVGTKLEEYMNLYKSELTATPYIQEQNDHFFKTNISDIKPSCRVTSCSYADVVIIVIRVGVINGLIYDHDWNQDSFDVFNNQQQSDFYKVDTGGVFNIDQHAGGFACASDQYMCMMFLIIRELKKKYVFENFNYNVDSNIVKAKNVVYYLDHQLIGCTVNGNNDLIHHAYDIKLLVGHEYSYVYQ